MSNVFDLTKIKKAVLSHRPAWVLVVDTNVLMDHPDITRWSVRSGKTLFVLSDGISTELEYLKNKSESAKSPGSIEKARNAVRSLAAFYDKGDIQEGIPIDAGWVIGTGSPRRDELELEIRDLEDIKKGFHHADLKMLLLTKECSQSLSVAGVALLTCDLNLSVVTRNNGIPCRHCAGFPVDGMKATRSPVDWDRRLEETQEEIRSRAITVELTLTSQRIAPPWLAFGTCGSFAVAEGRGASCATTVRVGRFFGPCNTILRSALLEFRSRQRENPLNTRRYILTFWAATTTLSRPCLMPWVTDCLNH